MKQFQNFDYTKVDIYGIEWRFSAGKKTFSYLNMTYTDSGHSGPINIQGPRALTNWGYNTREEYNSKSFEQNHNPRDDTAKFFQWLMKMDLSVLRFVGSRADVYKKMFVQYFAENNEINYMDDADLRGVYTALIVDQLMHSVVKKLVEESDSASDQDLAESVLKALNDAKSSDCMESYRVAMEYLSNLMVKETESLVKKLVELLVGSRKAQNVVALMLGTVLQHIIGESSHFAKEVVSEIFFGVGKNRTEVYRQMDVKSFKNAPTDFMPTMIMGAFNSCIKHNKEKGKYPPYFRAKVVDAKDDRQGSKAYRLDESESTVPMDITKIEADAMVVMMFGMSGYVSDSAWGLTVKLVQILQVAPPKMQTNGDSKDSGGFIGYGVKRPLEEAAPETNGEKKPHVEEPVEEEAEEEYEETDEED